MRIQSPKLALLFIGLCLVSASAHGGSLTPVASGLLLHDDIRDVYWTRNANLQGGTMTWTAVNAWLNELNSLQYGGYNDWRLPTTPDGDWKYDGNTNSTKYNVASSELGRLFYEDLGLPGKIAPDGTTRASFGLGNAVTPFFNLQPACYWFGTISQTTLSGQPAVWKFDFQTGMQFLDTMNANPAYAVAVRSTTPAPEPSASLLFLVGLLGLFRSRFK